MTESRAVIDRLAAELHAMSWQLYRVSGDLAALDRLPHTDAPAARPAPAAAESLRPAAAPPENTPGDSGWIGKLLAVAGVAVTLVGVALLLVLAAQAGVLRPQVRVAGGFALSAALVAAACRLYRRPGGRIGAVALAATGIAAAYLDIIAVTAFYQWVPAPLGLAIAAVVGGTGLALARRWDSERLGVLVLVPLIGLAPVITGDVGLLLIGFLLALSAAALPVQLGRDWVGMFAARIAAPTLPLLATLVAATGHDRVLVGAGCAVAAMLAVVSGLLVLPATTRPGALAALTAVGTLPVLAAGAVLGRVPATVLAASLSVAMLAIVVAGRGLPVIVVEVFSALSAVAALIAVATALHGSALAPVLLAMAVVIAVAGRQSRVARWAATGFGFAGLMVYLGYAAPRNLIAATVMPAADTAATLAASLLVIAFVAAAARAYTATGNHSDPDAARMAAAAVGALTLYAVTMFTVTAGVAIGGTGGGFLAGHMAATICWIAMAAALLRRAPRLTDRDARALPVTAGLALTGAATAKLFLFDLGTLDGMFRVAAFICAGLLLLGMGTGYARSLAQHDAADHN